jgi:RNA recognition motif-containing protein
MEGQMNFATTKPVRQANRWDKPLNVPAPRPEAPAVPGRLYIGGLPRDITPEALSKLLTAFGVKVEHMEFNTKHVPTYGTDPQGRFAI